MNLKSFIKRLGRVSLVWRIKPRGDETFVVTHHHLQRSSFEERYGHVSVSMVMPAFNVSDNIFQSILQAKEALQRFTPDYEIVVVDDGSWDHTAAVIASMKDDRVKLIRNSVNHGKGFSVIKGVEHATGDYVIMCDADAEIGSRELERYLSQLRDCDMVISSKRAPLSSYDAPFTRKFLSAGFNKLVWIMTGLRMSDTQTGLKAFRRKPLNSIIRLVLVKRYAFDTELLVLAKLLKLRVAEAPVVVVQRMGFRAGDALRMFVDLCGISYRLRITRWYQKNLAGIAPEDLIETWR